MITSSAGATPDDAKRRAPPGNSIGWCDGAAVADINHTQTKWLIVMPQ
jgi:hypothetical protein